MPQEATNGLDDLADFVPMPAADSVVVADTDKPNIFDKESGVSLDFLDNLDGTDEDKAPVDTDETEATGDDANELDDLLNDTGDDESGEVDPTKPGKRGKTDKSGLVSVVNKMIEAGKLFAFEGEDKPYEDYTIADFEELFELNFAERERVIREQTPQEFYDTLPPELQSAAQYFSQGGTDIKGFLRAVSEQVDITSLDPTVEADQIEIIRTYLEHTNYGTDEDIDEEIQSLTDLGTLGKKAALFKPKLDAAEQAIIEKRLADQQAAQVRQQEAAQAYVANIQDVIAKNEIAQGGIKLDRRTQEFYYEELTRAKYKTMHGKDTNLLGHLLEKVQFEKPDFNLVLEVTMLLNDPEKYRETLRAQGSTEQNKKTIRTIKTEQGRNASGGGAPTGEQVADPAKTKARTVARTTPSFLKRS